ncbi:MAG: hypothetical protein H8F28_03620 [Fibrella sp.]|nr:hypothetical protein [Armatimonadota bacterium]
MNSLVRKNNSGTDRSQSRPLRLDFVRTMTDDTGMIQHGVGGVPDPHTGYTTDDNARAFPVMVRLWRNFPERRAEVEPLLRRYLQFLVFAQRRDNAPDQNCGGSGEGVNGDGWFRNFAGYARHFLEPVGSEDCLGRCIWVLGEADAGDLPQGVRLAVRSLLSRSRIAANSLTSPHATCYALLGLSDLAQDAGVRPLVEKCVDRLLTLWDTYSEPGWLWFEPQVTYDNARYCEALLRGGIVLGNHKAITVAREALDFLTEHSFDKEEGYLSPVGCRGWWYKGGEKAQFDQQTVEAGAYMEAYRLFARVFDEPRYSELAERSREWFWGNNIHRLPLYDPDSGGCFDGLTPDGVNLNMGAESVLSYLLAESCASR